jgi:RND family efflux transporter MFP subunit
MHISNSGLRPVQARTMAVARMTAGTVAAARPVVLAWAVFLACPGAFAEPAPDGGGRLECMVEPYREVKVSSAVPGVLEEVAVDRGDTVTKGQVLARLESGVEKAHLDLVKAKVAFAVRRAERNKELYRKQMISVHERDEMETEAEIVKLELKETEERLKQRTILSPLDGVVVKRLASAGEFVEEKPILELAQLNPLKVEVVAPVAYYGRIKVGMTAQVEWEAPINRTQACTVTIVDPVVDAASGTIGIRLEVANPKHQLPAGTKCRVRFPVSAAGTAGAKAPDQGSR